MELIERGKDNSSKKSVIMLDNPIKILSLEEQQQRQKRREGIKKQREKMMSSKEIKRQKLFEIPEKMINYDLFLPLHNLWKQYMINVFQDQISKHIPIDGKVLMKADLHGSIIKVIRSKCPSFVNITGILVKETQCVFNIVTLENSLKKIPKKNNVFSLEFEGNLIIIYGSHFAYRSADRSSRKWKNPLSGKLSGIIL